MKCYVRHFFVSSSAFLGSVLLSRTVTGMVVSRQPQYRMPSRGAPPGTLAAGEEKCRRH